MWLQLLLTSTVPVGGITMKDGNRFEIVRQAVILRTEIFKLCSILSQKNYSCQELLDYPRRKYRRLGPTLFCRFRGFFVKRGTGGGGKGMGWGALNLSKYPKVRFKNQTISLVWQIDLARRRLNQLAHTPRLFLIILDETTFRESEWAIHQVVMYRCIHLFLYCFILPPSGQESILVRGSV